jgi:hypothetical protein
MNHHQRQTADVESRIKSFMAHACAGDIEALRNLVADGFDLNGRNQFGDTILEYTISTLDLCKRSAPPPLEEQDHAGLLSGLRGNNSSMRRFGQEGSFSRVLVSQAMGSMSFMRAVSSRD